jgi:ferredoxin
MNIKNRYKKREKLNMAKNLIFYFTGTGNTLKVAKDIATGLGDSELVSMGKPYHIEGTYERIGFVYPVYVGGLPLVVERFLKSIDISTSLSSYYFAVCTYGGGTGGLLPISKILQKKGATLSYGSGIKCFANYVGLYPLKDNAEEKANEQAAQTTPIVADIENLARMQDFKSDSMALLHKAFLFIAPRRDKGFNVNENCIGCGQCSSVCPVGNIKMKNSKPTFLHHCEQCMACIQWCPKQAINYKDKTQDRSRYHHPAISFKELIEK